MSSYYNPKTKQIENARETIDEGMLPKNWTSNIINKIIFGDKKHFYGEIKGQDDRGEKF